MAVDIQIILDITVRTFAVTFFEDKDVFRIITAERQAQLATKESRKRKRLKRLGRDEDQAGREGFPGLAGGYTNLLLRVHFSFLHVESPPN